MSRVWEGFQGGGSELLTLLALADWSDDEGRCWPAMASIATKVRLSEKQARRVVHALIQAGILIVTDFPAGGATSRRYQINLAALTPPADGSPPMDGTPPADVPNPSRPWEGTPPAHGSRTVIDTSETRQENHPPTPQGVGEDFAAFWAAYPRKVGKGHAMKAWTKAKPPMDAVLAALDWQTKSEDWTKEGGRFTPHPSTWLTGRRWEDEPLSETKPPNRQMTMREAREAKRRAIYGRNPTTGNTIEGDFTRDEFATTPNLGPGRPVTL